MSDESPTGPFMGFNFVTVPEDELALAKAFGRKITNQDGKFCATAYEWLGKLYFIECKASEIRTG